MKKKNHSSTVKRVMFFSGALLYAVLIMDSAAHADGLRVARLFRDRAVLQQKMKVPVWGWAKAGTSVTVDFNGQNVSCEAGANGKWKVKLSPMNANSTPEEMTITAGNDKIVVKNILVGEVWLAGGQSNMGWRMWNSAVYDQGECALVPMITEARADARKEIETANDPLLRFFEYPDSMSAVKVWDDFEGRGYRDEHDPEQGQMTWVTCKPTKPINEWRNTGSFSAAGYYFAKKLRKELGVPVGIIVNAKGGTTIQTWMSEEALVTVPRGKEYLDQWQARAGAFAPERKQAWEKFNEKRDKWSKGGHKGDPPEPPGDPLKDRLYPSAHYNAMTAPLAPYAIRGALWYQGENNHPDRRENICRSYALFLEALIADWRRAFDNPRMDFYIVQLPPYERHKNERESLNSGAWTLMRDEQRKAAEKIYGVELICQIDNLEWDGSFGDFWPPMHTMNKVDIGNRMADMALVKEYGRKGVVYGPLYKSHKVVGNKVELTFKEVASGLMVGSKERFGPAHPAKGDLLKWFIIAGADRKWVRARARIVGKDKVEVWSDNVKDPAAVRYAWQINPYRVNFFNKEGLPASPFRTDNWHYEYQK
jgi:sialate O-acetylesterase